MALDGITVSAVVKELSGLLTGARISKIAQPENDELILTLKGTRGGQTRLLLSASASLPLIYITETNKPGLSPPPISVCCCARMWGNGKILRIWQPELERIIHFEIEHYDDMGDLRRKDLILELMGKHSNIIFCDENQTIIDSIKHISAQTSSVREVLPAGPILSLKPGTNATRCTQVRRNSRRKYFPSPCRCPRQYTAAIPASAR